MKAITKKCPAKIVGINIPTEKSEKIEKIATEHNAEFNNFNENCGNEKVGFLFGFKGFEKSETTEKTDKEILLFSGISGNRLNHFLDGLRAENATVQLKAVVTAYNQSWTISHLATQIEAEHKAMNGGGKNG